MVTYVSYMDNFSLRKRRFWATSLTFLRLLRLCAMLLQGSALEPVRDFRPQIPCQCPPKLKSCIRPCLWFGLQLYVCSYVLSHCVEIWQMLAFTFKSERLTTPTGWRQTSRPRTDIPITDALEDLNASHTVHSINVLLLWGNLSWVYSVVPNYQLW